MCFVMIARIDTKMKVKPYVNYFFRVLTHKYYVFKAGIFLKKVIPMGSKLTVWQLLIHDWHKFTFKEFLPYARYFHIDKESNKRSFLFAWINHCRLGKHHWEYWVMNKEYNFDCAKNGLVPMPTKYVYEMVADWMGASKLYTGSWDMTLWLENNLDGIKNNLHHDTIVILDRVLWILGYNKNEK